MVYKCLFCDLLLSNSQAQEFWPDESALGSYLWVGPKNSQLNILGTS